MTVLIAGCGDLGTEVGLRFVELGHDVVGLRRDASRLPSAISGRSIDLSLEKPVVPLGTEIVIVALAADSLTPESYTTAYVNGLRNLLDALDEAPVTPRRVLLVSSTAVYDVNDGSWVDELTPTNPRPGTAAVLLASERMLHTRIPEAVVLRLAGIYGPGRERLITQVRAGRATVSALSRHTNRIHRDDASAAIVHLMTRVEPPAQLYIGVDSAPVVGIDVLNFLAGELGLPVPIVVETNSRRGGDKRLRNQRLLDTGFGFTYPSYREGYRAILESRGTRHE
ncbi:NAD-dependent epimerase/dehydratase family protein [Cryobacterium algoritolerans]|uniref:NAD-dependent epimerase/dehydratase family protein n=1 Tax=Cryobacterium algoritolerans TaxID=1259184 RepID=A0A4R8WV19_9MICO|nr:NAD-dependent epimerase/dehydratase family protein [Cryobacterium algoritolerans]TFC17925.1 NAD-dependent epimerase/dehydratase family protein [Cryobacterium algoritolerans]